MNVRMTHVIDLAGVFVSSFIGEALLALIILLVLRPLLARVGFQRLVWNAPLAELGLLVCILGVLVLLF